jgi:glycopeptide antibiotics resistance protein
MDRRATKMRFVLAVPWFPAGMAITFVLGTILGGRVGRRLGVPAALGWVVIVSLGVVLAATLTPQREALEFGATSLRSCDFGRVGLAPLSAFRNLNDTSINVLVFIPLGVAIGLIPRSRIKAVVAVVAVLLPFGIETAQLLLPILDRGCQSADVIDNVTGLTLGFATGSLARWLGARLSSS